VIKQFEVNFPDPFLDVTLRGFVAMPGILGVFFGF